MPVPPATWTERPIKPQAIDVPHPAPVASPGLPADCMKSGQTHAECLEYGQLLSPFPPLFHVDKGVARNGFVTEG
jgi:hypothetical protein